uniref:Uncharacterized protein n=1 Tax=Oryza brachyantha TaxID=4533 RepID=J3N261_ORYBR
MGSTAAGGGGGFSSLALPKRFPVTAGPTANGGFVFFGLPKTTEQHSVGILRQERVEAGDARTLADAWMAIYFNYPVLQRDSVGSGGGRNRRSRQNLRVATPRRGSTRPRDEQQPVTPPPQKVAKTAAGEASFSSILSGSAGRPCCTFITLPTKAAAKQESNNSSGEASRSPVRPSSSVEKTIAPEREVEVSSAEREAPRASSPAAACTGAAVVVRVTCKCGVHKEFSFDHSH